MKRPLRFSMSLSILFLSPMSAIVSAAVDIPLSLSSEKNYIVEVVLPSGSTSANIEDGRITAEGASQALATVVYYDGLGRPEQTARVGFTATGADLLSTVGYDEAGREYRQGLPTPVSGNNGCYVNPSTYGSKLLWRHMSLSGDFVRKLTVEPDSRCEKSRSCLERSPEDCCISVQYGRRGRSFPNFVRWGTTSGAVYAGCSLCYSRNRRGRNLAREFHR